MTTTDVLALVGTVTGSAALLLDLVKWLRSGPRLRIRANPNMQPTQAPPGTPPGHWTLVRVSNVGDTPTTLLALSLETYSSWGARLLRRPSVRLAVLPTLPVPLPHRLEVSDDWQTVVKPDPRISTALDEGLLYVAIEDAHRAKPTRFRVER